MENFIGICVIVFIIIFFLLYIALLNIYFLCKDVKEMRKTLYKIELEMMEFKYNIKRIENIKTKY